MFIKAWVRRFEVSGLPNRMERGSAIKGKANDIWRCTERITGSKVMLKFYNPGLTDFVDFS